MPNLNSIYHFQNVTKSMSRKESKIANLEGGSAEESSGKTDTSKFPCFWKK